MIVNNLPLLINIMIDSCEPKFYTDPSFRRLLRICRVDLIDRSELHCSFTGAAGAPIRSIDESYTGGGTQTTDGRGAAAGRQTLLTATLSVRTAT